MAAPAIIHVTIFAVYPILRGAGFSLFRMNLMQPWLHRFVGLRNYTDALSDPAIRHSLAVTLMFTASCVAMELALGLCLALLLWTDNRFNRVATILMLVPITVTPIVVGLIFRALLDPSFGLIGYWLTWAHLAPPQGLLGDTHTALMTMMAVDVWEWAPLAALILLAGLKSLPADSLDAAAIDGAGPVAKLGRIILPMMLPSIFLVLVLRVTDVFRTYDIVFAATGGGPGDSTNLLMLDAVKQGLQFFDIGYGSAISILMTLAIAILAGVIILALRGLDRRYNTL
ncbi:sugar ABC transporter permease [Acidisoma cellulosilytica]|uniref:Sugar ABC transporter permease n=1 Tax=Acidisoma cellulosilyticum TaxID=2802395 RepID=A0A964E539_9PROT|nr:sugar ABC transporter permease [Acidisoma cellulosilyticum]MCB8882136.1 sugar ABC transporter permease [Acidisoma cellulosilyticum]